MYKINRDLFELDAEIAKLAEQIKPSDEAVIAVGRRNHGGVTMQVGHKISGDGGQDRRPGARGDDRISVT